MHEFLAEAFTNPEFQDVLETISSQQDTGSLAGQMIEAIGNARAFGATLGYERVIHGNDHRSMANAASEPETQLDRVIRMGVELMKMDRP